MEKMTKIYSLNFRGYWREINKGGVPTESGVYMVYRCVYNATNGTVRLIDIIYIGQSENVNERIKSHEKLDDFKAQLQSGEELCYAFAPVKKEELDVVEHALIYAQKPIVNDQHKNSFDHGSVSIIADGRCACLKYTNFKIS